MAPLLPEVPDRRAYAVLHPRVEGWLPAAVAVAQRHGLPRPGPADWLGGSDLVFGAGPGAVLKIACPLFQQQHDAERRVLERLGGRADLGAPALLAAGEVEGWPYLVQSRAPGRRLREAWGEVSPRERVAVAEEIGRRLGILHGLPCEGLGGLHLPWGEFVAGQVARVVERHRELGVPEELLASIPAAVAAAGPLPRPGVPEALLHADLTDENIHLVREGGRWRVAGILDFGDATVGDPEYDLMVPGVFVAAGDPVLLRALFRGAGRGDSLGDPALPARLLAWMLLHRFGTITPWVGRAPDPARASLAEGPGSLWRFDDRRSLPVRLPAMFDPRKELFFHFLAARAAELDSDATAPGAWEAARQALSGLPDTDADLRAAVEGGDGALLREILGQWSSGKRPLPEHDRDLLKRAMRAFRKRLRLTLLDDESTVGGGPMSGGRSSGISGVSPPRDYPAEIWRELARQGRLRNAGQGVFELPPGG